MTALDPITEAALHGSAIGLTTPGRHTGRPHRVVLWFVYHDGALHLLAHTRAHGQGTDWYRNLVAAGAATAEVGGRQLPGRPEPFPAGVDPHRYTVALFEGKYGVGAIDTWYDPALRIPVRLALI